MAKPPKMAPPKLPAMPPKENPNLKKVAGMKRGGSKHSPMRRGFLKVD